MSSTPEKKPVRRVRVIEIIDDGDGLDLDAATIDAVLAADAEAEAAAEPEVEAEPVKVKTVKAEPVEIAPVEAEPTEPEAEPAAAEVPRQAPKAPVVLKEGGGRLVMILTGAVVVLALVAGFALFKWQSAASPEEERAAVVARVTEYGNVLGSYPADGVDAAQQKVLGFLTGDALEERRASKLEELKQQLATAKVSLESRTRAVYVGAVDGNFASVVLVFDMSFTGPGGSRTVEKNHLTLGLVKQNGLWMVSSNAAAGNEQSTTGAVPGFSDGQQQPTSPPISSPGPVPTK
ncbi:hypothetical protein GCM10027589_27180 [Actinocorallia lasiicapitis]